MNKDGQVKKQRGLPRSTGREALLVIVCLSKALTGLLISCPSESILVTTLTEASIEHPGFLRQDLQVSPEGHTESEHHFILSLNQCRLFINAMGLRTAPTE